MGLHSSVEISNRWWRSSCQRYFRMALVKGKNSDDAVVANPEFMRACKEAGVDRMENIKAKHDEDDKIEMVKGKCSEGEISLALGCAERSSKSSFEGNIYFK